MRLRPLVWLLLFLVLLLIYRGTKESSSNEQLMRAYSQYVQGEKAATIAERKEAFNQSLEEYTRLERAFSPTLGDGKLYFNIANCYFQLEQYPLAIYYYYQAKALRPRDSKVTQNLRIAQGKLGIAPDEKQSYISLPERLQLFFGLSLAALGCASLQIWFPFSLWKRFTLLFSLLTAVVFLNLVYIHYLAPTEGVLIRAASLYRDAGEQYALVLEKPLFSGIKVEVLDTRNKGAWLKIQTPEGDLGFIPKDSIRVIE